MAITILGLIWIPFIIMNALIPMRQQPGIHFGLMIPMEHTQHNKLRAIGTRYAILSITAAILFMVLSLVLVQQGTMTAVASAACFIPVYLFVHFLIYVQGYYAVRRLKEEQQWTVKASSIIAIDTSDKTRKTISRMWYLLPLWLIALNIVFVAWNYDHIPDSFPMHYDASGQVDRVADKSIGIVFAMNMIQLFLTAIMLGVQEAILRKKRQINPAQAAASQGVKGQRSEGHQAVVIHLITLIAIVLFAFVQFAIIQIIDSHMLDWILIAAIALIFIVIVSLAAVKRKEPAPSSGGEALRHEGSDKYWKWGLFYVNRNDAALFVEKRGGIGITVNLGRMAGWVCLLSPVWFAAIIILFTLI